jgi:site-specific recombinase XerD
MNDLYLRPTPGSLPRLWLNGKGDTQRVVYLSDQALTALQNWLDVRPTVEDQAVFVSRLKRQMTVTAIQLRLMRHCHEAGVWITCHQLRHTFGRHLVEAGVPVTSIQRLMGHTRIRTTQVYLHISDRKLQTDYEAAMDQIDTLLPEGGSQ